MTNPVARPDHPSDGTEVVRFRGGYALMPALWARGDAIGLVAKRDLGRLYGLLRGALLETGLTPAHIAEAAEAWPAPRWEYGCQHELVKALATPGATDEATALRIECAAAVRSARPTQLLSIVDAAERLKQSAAST